MSRTVVLLDEPLAARRYSQPIGAYSGGSMAVASGSVLTQTLLDRCRERAPRYDRDNTFCREDFDELKAAGYLLMAVPKELGGQGMSLAQVARETRLLAQYSPATALCINMHNYWVGDAADLGVRATSRASGSSGMQRPARCSRRAMPSTGTIFRA